MPADSAKVLEQPDQDLQLGQKGFRHELLATGFHKLRLEGLSIVLQPEMETFCQSSVQGQYVCC